MGKAVGKKVWAVPEGYIPAWSNGPEPDMLSHDSLSFLNTGEQEAHVDITIFYSDREPAGPYKVTVPASRTKHVRINNLKDPEPVPAGTEYSILVESDLPIVVQYTRLDSRQAENALLSTLAFPVDEA